MWWSLHLQMTKDSNALFTEQGLELRFSSLENSLRFLTNHQGEAQHSLGLFILPK